MSLDFVQFSAREVSFANFALQLLEILIIFRQETIRKRWKSASSSRHWASETDQKDSCQKNSNNSQSWVIERQTDHDSSRRSILLEAQHPRR